LGQETALTDDNKSKKKTKKEKPPEAGQTTPDKNKKKAEKGADELEDPTVLKDHLAAEKDRVLRLSAEFENYKKRKERELSDFKKFANETVFKAAAWCCRQP
jgi:molecular chaperone GrpE